MPIRVYKLIDPCWGLQSILDKRLKLTSPDDTNDPWDLQPFDSTDPRVADILNRGRSAICETSRLLCFSKGWSNPMIWGHYAEKHRGIALGFKIDESKLFCESVNYISDPLPPPASGSDHETNIKQLLLTKFQDWQYEQEYRVVPEKPMDQIDGHHFYNYDDRIDLVEVVMGVRCALTASQIRNALGTDYTNVVIKKAKRAPDKFAIIEDESFREAE